MNFNLPELPDGWTFSVLENCAQKGSISYGVVQPGMAVADGVPMIRVNNFKEMRIDLSDVMRIAPQIESKYARTRLAGGEVLLTLVGSVGQVAIVPTTMAGFNVARAVAVIHPLSHIEPEWIGLCLRSPLSQHILGSRANTTVQTTINLKDVRALPIPIPPEKERRQITEMLTKLDDRIALLRETNITLEAIAQAQFKSWFVDFDPVHAKLEGREPEGMDDLTSALFPGSLTDSELGNVPTGWRIGNFGDFINRLSAGKKYDQKSALPVGSVPILDQGKSGTIGFHNDEPSVKASLDSPVVVFANHTCYMRLISYDFSAIQNVLPFVGKDVDIVWAYFATKDRVKFSEYKGHWPDFAIEKAIIPSLATTIAYRVLIDPMIRRIRLNEMLAQTLTDLRDMLLPRLISGQLQMPDAEDELHEVLN